MRRLRKQRGLKLSDFDVLEKTVARIERGQVKHPRKKTLIRIARLLRVAPEHIADY
jgi:transcriptional regulator with XRE-family HTH domain